MDPASLAIGVLPLVINIAEAASAVRHKRSDYKSAPADIQNILDKTELIGRVCSRLAIDLRSPTSRYETSIIEQALQKCYSSVSKVHGDLEMVSRHKQGRRRSMQYVFSKVHIDRSLSDLNDSISMLNTCIGMSTCLNMNAITSAHLHVNPAGGEEKPTAQEAAVETTHRFPKQWTIEKQRRRPIKSRSSRSSLQNSWFLYERLASFVSDENDKNERTHRSYLVGSPLLGTFVNLAVRYGPLSPFNLTLDSPRFIYEKHDKALFDEIMRRAPGFEATPRDVSQWVAQFNVKPNTQLVGEDDHRCSLLGLLVAWNKYETYKYFLDQGNQQLGSEQHLFYGVSHRVTSYRSQYETIKLYINMRGPLLTMEEYAVILMPSRSPTVVDEMVDLFQGMFVDELEDFLSETLESLVCMFISRNRRFDVKIWASSVSKLLSAGLDIHISSVYMGHTALNRIMTDEYLSILDILNCSEKWIEVLEHTSVDVDRYLYTEFMILLETMELGFEIPEEWMAAEMEPWHAMDVKTKLEVMFDILHPGYRVPLHVDPASTDDLLQIMPALREAPQPLLSVDHGGPFTHIDWKHDRMEKPYTRSDSWPFLGDTASLLCSQRHLKGLSEKTTKALASHDRFLQLISDRFETRQQKKWKKLKKNMSVTEETGEMPGGWKMEWWEYQGGW